MTAENLLAQALQLPLGERATMARQLLLSLEPDLCDDDYESQWQREIAERVKRLDEGKSQTFAWRQTHEEIRDALRKRNS